ncbi:hypothetical protein DSO57_1025619 [Entomophthora muscae]|uniref:Uncharacterized protein n=1 Tax=Entomophthora muscae TaxID=34485 RepID=A0ACC2TDE5_9FUNG|nr:hypothetical protein DSO57_1025619 [Entomophthora muscae]
MNFLTFFLSLCIVSAANKLRSIDDRLGKCHGIEIRELTINQAHEYFKSGSLTPEKLTECYLNRIKEMNPFLNAVIEVNPDALKIAKTLPEELKTQPLYGIPILVKDNIATKDKMNTTAGNPSLLSARPKDDAEVVKRLRRAGAIILGKANLSEMSG